MVPQSLPDRFAFAVERAVRALALPFFSPSRVGAEPLLADSKLTASVFALTYGLVGIWNALARRDLRGKPDLLHLETWSELWLFTLGLGLVWAAFAYWFGGWWFQVRLYMSDVNPIDFARARNIFLTVCQVSALPGLAWTIGETLYYPSPAEAREYPGVFVFGLLAFGVWSVVSEYRAVRGAFRGTDWKVRTWFLTIPLLLPVLLIALAFLAL